MISALSLYEKFGFVGVNAYYATPLSDMIFLTEERL